jgi:hypothetical protein
MFDYDTSVLIVESRRARLLQSAGKARLAKIARSDRQQPRFYHALFVGIGSLFMNLGSRLHRRYAVSGSESPVPPIASNAR